MTDFRLETFQLGSYSKLLVVLFLIRRPMYTVALRQLCSKDVYDDEEYNQWLK